MIDASSRAATARPSAGGTVSLVELRPRQPGVLLALAGEGPAVPHLPRRVRELGLANAVQFVGYLRRDGEVQDCYAVGDLFVFASRTGTQGLVLLEALALGVPVVALAALGTRESVLPGRGACAAPDDPAGFAAVVSSLMHDPDAGHGRHAPGRRLRRSGIPMSRRAG